MEISQGFRRVHPRNCATWVNSENDFHQAHHRDGQWEADQGRGDVMSGQQSEPDCDDKHRHSGDQPPDELRQPTESRVEQRPLKGRTPRFGNQQQDRADEPILQLSQSVEGRRVSRLLDLEAALRAKSARPVPVNERDFSTAPRARFLRHGSLPPAEHDGIQRWVRVPTRLFLEYVLSPSVPAALYSQYWTA